MASSTEILALCDMLKQSKLHVCISIRVVASFGRKITGGVGASLVVRDARRPDWDFSSRFYLSLRMVCAIVLVARVADRPGSWSSLPLSEGGVVAKWYVCNSERIS